MPSGRFEIQYDTDPSEQVVLSTIYLEGGFSLNGATQQASGTISELGFVNEAGHYFYGTGLDVTLAELEALPPGSTTTELLQAVFQSDADTVYTATDLTIPEGFERVVIEDARDVAIVANSLDNLITGNAGDNKVDGGAGFDTFVTQGSVYGATGTLNIDGSVTITTAQGGSDTLTNVELVQVAGDSASSAAPSDYLSAAERTYTADPSQVFSQVLPEISTGDGRIQLSPRGVDGEFGSVVLSSGEILTVRNVLPTDGVQPNQSQISAVEICRYLEDGTLDLSFGVNGSTYIENSGWYWQAHYITVQESHGGDVLFSTKHHYQGDSTVYRITKTGEVYVSYTLPLDVGNTYQEIVGVFDDDSVALGGDGQPMRLAFGNAYNPSTGSDDYFVSKFYEGVLTGRTYLAKEGQGEYANAAVKSTDGSIYLLGEEGGHPNVVIKFTGSGVLDETFGIDGQINLGGVSSQQSRPLGISTDSSGNVLVAYYTSTYSGPGTSAQIEVARFLPDGSYDSSFGGGDGRAVIDMSGDSSWTQDGAQLLTVDSQDRPVLAFQRFWGTEVVRLNTDGSIDRVFTEPTDQLGSPSGSGVDPIFDLAPGSSDRPAWVQVDSDDNILVGVVDSMSIDGVWQQTYTITKFLESGGLDLSFDEVPPPTYSLTSYDGSGLPTWLSFDAQTRTISGTPGVLDGGQDFYVLTATDYLGNTTSEFFSIDVTQLNPEFVFSASIDSVTGLITVDSGWTGPLEGLQYVVQGVGATYLDSTIDNDFGLSGISSNGTAGMASVSVGGTSAEAVSGDGSFARIMLKAEDGVRDVVVSAANILFDEVGDISNTDVTPPASISFAVGASVGVVGTPSLDVTEGSGAAEARKVSIDLALDRAIMTNQSVSWSIVPNGEAGVDTSDFVGGVLPSGVVNFVAGQTMGKIEFEIAADTTVERAEGYKVVLAPSGGLVVSGSSELIGEIANDDKATVSIKGNSVLLPEGNSGVTSYSFTVELDQPAFGNQTVDWMVDFVPGEASATDFSGFLSGSLSFAEGETSKTITIGVQGDTLKEGREDFKIKLANASSDLVISDTDGVIDVQIKDDDGYDLNGQVYFWKDQTVTQADQVTRTGKWLMDDVDVSVVGVDPSLTLDQLKAMPIKMGTVELNTDSGRAQAELWVQHTDVTSFQFEVAKGAYNANFASSLTTGWTVSVEDKGQTVLIGGIYNGATGTQTLDRIKIGVVSFDTPAEGQSIQMGLMSSQASNDAQQTNATGPVTADLTFVTTTDGSATAVFAGGFESTGLTEGLYLVDADKDFTGVSFTQAEIKSVTTADARAALLMALGREPTISDHQYIAADIDGDGRVTTNDARNILGVALGKPTQMEMVQWRFVDEDADLTGLDMNHVKQGVDWQQGVDLLLNDDATHNMIAILLGDVDGTYKPEDYLTHQII
jgi:hypothetical protein